MQVYLYHIIHNFIAPYNRCRRHCFAIKTNPLFFNPQDPLSLQIGLQEAISYLRRHIFDSSRTMGDEH